MCGDGLYGNIVYFRIRCKPTLMFRTWFADAAYTFDCETTYITNSQIINSSYCRLMVSENGKFCRARLYLLVSEMNIHKGVLFCEKRKKKFVIVLALYVNTSCSKTVAASGIIKHFYKNQQ